MKVVFKTLDLKYEPLPLLKFDRFLSFLYESSEDVDDVFGIDDDDDEDEDEFRRDPVLDKAPDDDEFNAPDELDLDISDFVAVVVVEDDAAGASVEFDGETIDAEPNDALEL